MEKHTEDNWLRTPSQSRKNPTMDIYVPSELSRETARHIPNCSLWVTNEWENDGIGHDGAKNLERILYMLSAPRLLGNYINH